MPPNLALTQTSECRHSYSRPDDTLSNFGSVRAILGGDDDGLRAGKKLKVLFHLLKSVGKALPPVLFTLGDRDSSHRVHAVIDTFTSPVHHRVRHPQSQGTTKRYFGHPLDGSCRRDGRLVRHGAVAPGQRVGLTEGRINRILKQLEKEGFIEIEGWTDPDTGNFHCSYRVIPEKVEAEQRKDTAGERSAARAPRSPRKGNKGSFSKSNQPKNPALQRAILRGRQ